jgi:hypothetical protein
MAYRVTLVYDVEASSEGEAMDLLVKYQTNYGYKLAMGMKQHPEVSLIDAECIEQESIVEMESRMIHSRMDEANQ